MAGRFNFTTKLGLDSAGFRQGVNKVKSSINELRASFLSFASALGAGLGFTQLISSMKNTATELSVAMNTLKNASTITKAFEKDNKDAEIEVTNFHDSLAFVKDLANKYAQDLVAVTDNYAKFIAACKKTNLTLDDQRFIFEALTKAAAFYHLSADRTADMMNAVVQMMSKGKVAAEELRRQLGNTLPGAFNLMAAAMGVSTAKLEDMMKNGEVLSADVLPKFAAMLNAVTRAGEFDSLQASLNKFKNAWYALVEKSGAENMFKKLVDGSTSALNAVTNNMRGIKSTFVGLITYLTTSNIRNIWRTNTDQWIKDLEDGLQTMESMVHRREAMFKKNPFVTSTQVEGANIYGIDKTHSSFNASDKSVRSAQIQIMKYHQDLIKVAEEKLKLKKISKDTYETIVSEARKANGELGSFLAGIDMGEKTVGRFRAACNKAGASLKAFFAANWVTLLLSVLAAAINYFVKIKQEAKAIAAISEEYANKIVKVEGTTEEQASILRNNLEIVKDTTASESARIFALKEINKQMGLVGDKAFSLASSYDEITLAVERWIEATKKQAIIQAHANTIADATAKKAEAQRRIEEIRTKEDNNNIANLDGTYNSFGSVKREVKNLRAEIEQYDKAIAAAEEAMKKYGVELGDFFDVLGGNTDDENIPFEELQGIFEKYKKAEKGLRNQLKEKSITEEEFNKELDKLVQEYWKAATATGGLTIKDIVQKMNNGETLTEMEKWYYKLSKDAVEAAKRALIDGFSKELMKELEKEIEKAAKDADDALEKELEKEFKKQEKVLELDLNVITGDYDVPKRGTRDNALDYQKKNSDIVGGELDVTQDWVKQIADNYTDLIKKSSELGTRTDAVKAKLKELSEYYRYAAQEAETLVAAMNYQKIVEDIKDVEKEIDKLTYSGIKDFAMSLDRVVSAAENLEKTFNDIDATDWDKFMAVFNMITQVIDSAVGIYQTITTIQGLQAKLGAAKIAEQTALNQLLKEEIALRMAAQGASAAEIAQRFEGIGALLAEKGVLAGILGLKQAEATQTATNTTLKGGEAAASAAAASASAADAVAGATASGAKMPFPLNLIAIAAGIAAVVGALAMMGKFAKGGIVGGNSAHGDRNLARVNSGEMILNKAQQGTLWGLLNGKGSIGNNVEFKIRGADLVGTINNYGKKISK